MHSHENIPSQFSVLSSTVPMVTCEQPSHQAAADPFADLSRSSTIASSGKQFSDQTAITSGISNVQIAKPGTSFEQPQNPAASELFTEQPTVPFLTTPSDYQPTVSAGRVPSMDLVCVRKKGKYQAHDKVDRYLLLQVSRHVQTDMVELLAAYLGVSEEQYVDTRTTRTQPANPKAQVMKVCKDTGIDFELTLFFSLCLRVM